MYVSSLSGGHYYFTMSVVHSEYDRGGSLRIPANGFEPVESTKESDVRH